MIKEHSSTVWYYKHAAQLQASHHTCGIGNWQEMVKMGEELGQCCQIQNASTKVCAHQLSFSSLKYDDMQFLILGLL